jgi:protein TonB
LMQIQPKKLEVGDIASMEVRMVPAAQLTPPQPEINVPPPEDTPPPTPELESMIQPPLPDLPPPTFPVQAPPPKPKPPPPKPQPTPAVPTTSIPQAAAPAAPAAPKTISQVAWLTPPSPLYPARSRRAGEQGTVTVKMLIDATGRPTEVSVQGSSGHPALDESAVSAVRAARARPYSEGGIPQPVWVNVPINFVLQ